MREDVFTGLQLAAWAPAAASFVFGIAIGWLIFGGREASASSLRTAPPVEGANTANDDALDALRSQIEKARDVIHEGDDEIDEFADQLNALDASLKRIHTRLKTLFRAARRG